MSTSLPSPAPDDESLVDRALSDFRRDLASVRANPGLVDRVVARTRGGDFELDRFRRFARAYSAAAAVLLAAGAAGAYAMRRPPTDAGSLTNLADLEASRIEIERTVSVADLAVGGR